MATSEHRPPEPSRRAGWLPAVVLLAAGAIAWVIALSVILNAVHSESSPTPEASPQPIAERPTLAAATHTPLPTWTPTLTPTQAPTITPTGIPTQTPSPPATSAALAPTEAATSQNTSANSASDEAPLADAAAQSDSPIQIDACAPPNGWERYTVQQDDTLFAFVLGAGGGVTVEDLMAANCLDSRYLQVGQLLYLPPGAAENAPPSVPVAPSGGVNGAGPTGPRTPNCPCTIGISEGWRREQVAGAINAAQTMFTGADFLNVTGPGASAPYDFVMERPGGTSLEGFLFPGTYTVQNDTTAEGFRNMLLDAFAANVSPQMRADAAAQGVSFYQALIIASVVQREVHGPDTQKLVASVYYNRYRDGNRLASVVPIQYGLGEPGNWWPRLSGAMTKIDTPYNTYIHAGLPPTPIDSPGLSAILAAIYPPQTDYYYHTASCHGGEAFAVTYEEHLANVNCEN